MAQTEVVQMWEPQFPSSNLIVQKVQAGQNKHKKVLKDRKGRFLTDAARRSFSGDGIGRIGDGGSAAGAVDIFNGSG
jgi:hypothetical protein